jgi:hypothetical protein
VKRKECVMKRSWKSPLLLLPLVAGMGLALVAGPLDAQQKNVVVSKKVAAAPALDGTMDAAWQAAEPLTVKAARWHHGDHAARRVHAGHGVLLHSTRTRH